MSVPAARRTDHPISREIRLIVGAVVAGGVVLAALFFGGSRVLARADELQNDYYEPAASASERLYQVLRGVRAPTLPARYGADDPELLAAAERAYSESLELAEELRRLRLNFGSDPQNDRALARLGRAIAGLKALHEESGDDRGAFARALGAGETYLEIVAGQGQRQYRDGARQIDERRRVTFTGLGIAALIVIAAVVIGTRRYVVRGFRAIDDMLDREAAQSASIAEGLANLAEAQAIARVGSWEIDHATGGERWSAEMYRIVEVEADKMAPSHRMLVAAAHPEDRSRVAPLFEEGTPRHDVTWRLVLADGRIKHVRSRGESPHAHDARAIGTLQDITEVLRTQSALEAALREKEVLLKEVYHRVKNNLQVVSSLLNMQGREVRDVRSLRLFEESASRVRSMALVHEQLYRSRDLSKIVVRDFLSEFVAQISDAYAPLSRNVPIEVHADDLELGLENAVPCALILNELVANAYRHAFDENSKGLIRLELGRISHGLARLAVRDNGRGFPPDFAPERVPSLGMRIVTTLARQLGGEMRFYNDGGACVEVTFVPAKVDAKRSA